MSLTEQLIEEIGNIVSIIPKWKTFNDELPDSSKIREIYVWDGYHISILRANWVLWQSIDRSDYRQFTSIQLPSGRYPLLKNNFKCWRALTESDKPPVELR